MKKKLTNSQIRMLLCLLVAVIFALSYEFVYMNYSEKAVKVKAETEDVKKQIEKRTIELEDEKQLESKYKDVNSQLEGKITTYPVKIQKEDNLVFVEKIEQDLNMDIQIVNVGEGQEFYKTILPIRNEKGEVDTSAQGNTDTAGVETTATTIGSTATTNSAAATDNATTTDNNTANTDQNNPQPTAAATTDGTSTNNTSTGTTDGAAPAQDASAQTNMVSMQCSIDVSFQTTYQGFKDFVKYINTYPEKTSLSNLSLNYDASTGDLVCSATINRFSLTGTGKTYEEPDIGNISIGTDNIFGGKAQ